MKKSFLAGLSHAEFLRRHWQKKPLFVRDALSPYVDALTRDTLFDLATRDDVESRIVVRSRGRWQVRHGPFARSDLRRMPRSGWTLLVQGVDRAVPEAARLLAEFSFIPHARLDDVMVSYAAPGGGVGPHFDSYDVFLVQGAGERRWQLSAQTDLALVPDAPLKLLARFAPEREIVAAPGDLLYLPPDWAHDGVARGECITYSVGFRAPAASELGARFLEFLQDRLDLEGRYSDPGLEPARRPGEIPQAMVAESVRTLERLRWSERDVAEFLGRHLTEPKANVVFDRPARKLGPKAFARAALRSGVRLAPGSRMLSYGRRIFVNGEMVAPAGPAARALARLADERVLRAPVALDSEALRLLYDWYTAGYIEL